jgi:plasmid stabilization system protein ParE
LKHVRALKSTAYAKRQTARANKLAKRLEVPTRLFADFSMSGRRAPGPVASAAFGRHFHVEGYARAADERIKSRGESGPLWWCGRLVDPQSELLERVLAAIKYVGILKASCVTSAPSASLPTSTEQI